MKPELLSPAGSLDALSAAISQGADAIYLGASSHGARASVGFDNDSLLKAIRLAHLYGRKVYITVNTLLKEAELDSARQVLATLTALKADAVIVQDLGLIKLIQEEFPDLVIHASTQMSVHNARGALNLKKLGVSRVVLARECTLSDIREVAKTGIETEVFVHGAMCVSISGQCLFSSQIGGRSGNRGKCAQPCRLQYTYRDQKGALLSMRDMNTLEHLPAFLDVGVQSFKIEGRLKRPEYVGIVTSIYHKALLAAVSGKPLSDLEKEQMELTKVFSRGFTSGHHFSAQDSALIGISRVSHLGIQMGSIQSFRQKDGFVLAQAKLSEQLNNGDGLQIRGKNEQDFIYSGPAVPKGEVATLRLRQSPSPGDLLFRLQDEEQLENARKAAQSMPPLPFDARLTLNPGEAARLFVKSGNAEFEATGDIVQTADKQPLSLEYLQRLIGKTGGTPFVLHHLEMFASSPVFLPSAAINALRRDALNQLEETVIAAHERPATSKPTLSFDLPKISKTKPRIFALIQNGMDREAFLSAGAEQIIVYLDNYRQEKLEEHLEQVHKDDILLLPRQIDDEDLSRVQNLVEARGLSIMADNLAHLKGDVHYAGEGIPVWNTKSQEVLRAFGVKSAVLSRELSLSEVKLLNPDTLELILPVYGRTQLMFLNHCSERVSRSLSKHKAGCTFCERGHGLLGQTLKDRMSAEYPLSPTHFNKGCLITLYHHKVQHLGQLAPKMSWLLDLRFEKMQDALAVCAYYAALLREEDVNDLRPTEPGRALLGVE